MRPLCTRFPSAGKGPPWREMPASVDFLNLSSRVHSEEAPTRAPSKEPLQRERETRSIHLKVPVDEPSSRLPKRGPLERDAVFIAFSTYHSGSPAREPSVQVPFMQLPQIKAFHLQSPFQPYLKVPDK